MVKTRRGVNTSGKTTKGKKKCVGTSDDICMQIDPPIVNVKAQKGKEQKLKAKWSKTPVSTVGEDVLKGDGVDVSEVDEVVTEGVKIPSAEDLGDKVESSVKDTIHGLKGDSTSGGDVLKPTVDDFVKDTMVEGMDAAIPNVVDTELVTAKAADGGDIPSVTDTNAETAGKEERPIVGQGVDGTLDADIQEVIPKDDGRKKKSKKRKHKKSVEAGETSEPKKKLSKEERATKRARKAERKAKRDTEKAAEVEATEDDVPEEAEESVPEYVMPSVTQPTVDDECILHAQKEVILTTDDTEGLSSGAITVRPKLMEGTHIADILLASVDASGASGSNTDGIAQLLRDEIRYLDGVIQSNVARKSVLEARLRSLNGENDPEDEPVVGDNSVKAP
ncbi:hypothetical protein LIER_36041 [Lithospermum erythrorhizon]|uniref:Uncharacterized protein n=1 Tax=Lithospermum erythrorhizon TaxID=34254 RepID=A0AAV3NZX3_LITER